MKGLIFVYALTFGGSLVALFRPYIGLLIYIAWAILRPEALWAWAIPPGSNLSRIVGIALLIGWLLQGFGSWNLGRSRGIVLALVCYFLWSIPCSALAVADSAPAWIQVQEYAKVVLPFLVGITTIRSIGQLKALAWVIVLSQGYLAYEFNLLYYFPVRPFIPDNWQFGGLDRNGIAITMVTSAGLAFFLGLDAKRQWQRWLALALAALMVHVVLFSLSRGGMVALVVTAVVTFLLIPKRPIHFLLFIVAILVGLRLAGDMVVARFLTAFGEEASNDYSAVSRLQLWQACIQAMLTNPFFGLGPNNWRLVAHHYGFTVGKDAHTMWLHVGAEMGVIGLLFLVLFYGGCILKLWPLTRERRPVADPWLRSVARMVIAALAGFAVSAQFVSVYGVELPFYIVLLGCGALLLDSRPELVGQPVPQPLPPRAAGVYPSGPLLPPPGPPRPLPAPQLSR